MNKINIFFISIVASKCVDTNGWDDNDGFNCAHYSKRVCLNGNHEAATAYYGGA